MRTHSLKTVFLLSVLMFLGSGFTTDLSTAKKKQAVFKTYVHIAYPEQLTNPQKKNRKSLSQFGYGLYLFRFPMYKIGQFIDPKNFGKHSYGKPDIVKENNGVLYTCRGGFIDFAHLRCALDWTVYLSFAIMDTAGVIELEPEGGKLELKLQNIAELSPEDISALAQKIAFERLAWHEAASWYYHPPNYTFNEQQSAFTPEDLYSDYLGTVIGRNIVLRILHQSDSLDFSEIATEEIDKVIALLEPMHTVEKTKEAYDQVDRYKQLKLPEAKRNKDTWWDSGIIFSDPRYVYKRDMDIGPVIDPWLVPNHDSLQCPANSKPQVYRVPEKTAKGLSLHNYYTLTIHPDSTLFFAKKSGKQLHPTFGTFTSKNLQYAIDQATAEMEKELKAGFNKRDSRDPVVTYKRIKRVFFK